MAKKLDINALNNGFTKIKIGHLTKDIINILNLNRDECDIMLWEDRFKYIEKHKCNYKNENEYYKHIEIIPEIIENPDYVGKHPRDNSIQYIKRIDMLMIVGVRIKNEGDLNFRTAYPLTDTQLNDYIKSGTVWKVK